MRKIIITTINLLGWLSILLPQSSYAAGFVEAIKKYPDEWIVISCIFALISGTIISSVYEVPTSSTSKLSPLLKGGLSFIGGIAAFIYMISTNKELFLIQSLGVLAISITSPALFNILYTMVVQKIINMLNNIFPTSGSKED